MNKIRVAIIGYGRSGRNIHRQLLNQLPGQYEIAAIADREAWRRDMIREENSCAALSAHTELYGRKDIDLVVNASLSNDHAPVSVDLLEHGFNVLSEKPAAGNAVDFEKILETAQRAGKAYYIFQQYRFAPSYSKIKEVIDSGVLGRIVQINLNYSNFNRRWDWQTVQAFTAGSLLNTGPHPVDQALDLMGFPDKVDVKCVMDRAHTYGDAEDYVKLILTAEGAPLADIEISSCNAFSDHTYLVQGDRGTLKGTVKQLRWKYYIEEEAEKKELILAPLRNEKNEPIYCSEKLAFHEGDWVAENQDADDFNAKGLAFYRQLHKSMTEGAPFPVTHQHVLKQMKVMEESHRQNEKRLNKFILV